MRVWDLPGRKRRARAWEIRCGLRPRSPHPLSPSAVCSTMPLRRGLHLTGRSPAPLHRAALPHPSDAGLNAGAILHGVTHLRPFSSSTGSGERLWLTGAGAAPRRRRRAAPAERERQLTWAASGVGRGSRLCAAAGAAPGGCGGSEQRSRSMTWAVSGNQRGGAGDERRAAPGCGAALGANGERRAVPAEDPVLLSDAGRRSGR